MCSHPSFQKATLLLALALAASFAPRVLGQQSALGSVDFPVTTESAEARAHFLRGLAALHSFWYEEALEEFRAATKADPGFVMGYWGEAMAHNHPIWLEQQTEAGREALRKIKDEAKLTPRERAYVAVARTLYGEGTKDERDRAYSAAMLKLHTEHPEDLEAAAFYSLSLLGLVRPGEKGFTRQMKAGAIALDVYQKNPNHPGAAHYVIHAFDDPEHAVLALPAARRYAEIAPEAHHARHMPSHIFIQLGMWPEAARSNESAWEASVNWVRRKNLSPNLRDFHSLHWLTYVYLQQGRYKQAEEQLALLRAALSEASAATNRMSFGYASMAAAYVVETERWDAAEKILDPPASKTETSSKTETPQTPSGAGAAHAGHGGPGAAAPQAGASAMYPTPRRVLPVYARGMAAASRALDAEAARYVAQLEEFRRRQAEGGDAQSARVVEVMSLSIAALLDSARGRHTEAAEKMRRATRLEEEMSPPSGPPDLIKPSHELFGEILLRAGRAREAAAEFTTSLARQPNRPRSLLGAARAAAKAGDRAGAQTAYANFLRTRERADADLPEVKEARDYLAQTADR